MRPTVHAFSISTILTAATVTTLTGQSLHSRGLAAAVSISITNDVPLSFGTVIVSRTAGAVTLSPTGGRTCGGGVYPFDAIGFSPATFTIRGSGSSSTATTLYSLTWPSHVTLKASNGATMTIDNFQSDSSGPGQLRGSSGADTRSLGATLHVSANQPPGYYSGLLYVTISLGN